jgi:hypothetical protein
MTDITIKLDASVYKCCVCVENIIATINTCMNSHSICNKCTVEIKKRGPIKCPLCRTTEISRNYMLEKAVSSLMKICDNKECNVKVYESDMKEHLELCEYSTIKCIWCNEDTTTFGLTNHLLISCAYQSSRYTGPHSNLPQRAGNCFMVAEDYRDRVVFVRKTEDKCDILCLQMGTCIDDNIILSTSESKIEIPIHSTNNLVTGDINITSIPLATFAEYKNLSISGLITPYTIGSQWLYYDCKNTWTRSTIIDRAHNPNVILMQVGNDPRHTHVINIDNTDLPSVIRPTVQIHVVDEQLETAIMRSLIEQ